MRLTPRFLGVARNDEGKNVIQSGAGVPPDFHQADNLAKLWREFLPLFELIAQILCVAQILCAVEIAKTNAVFVNRPKCSCFYLWDSHVVSLLGMT